MNRKFQYGLATIIIAIIVLFIMGKDAVSLLKEPVKLNDIMDYDKVEKLKAGDHVIVDVKMSYGAEIGVYTTKNGVKQGESSRYYIVPYFDSTGEYEYWLIIDVAKKDFAKMDRAIDVYEKLYTELSSNDKKIIEAFTSDGVMKVEDLIKITDMDKKTFSVYRDRLVKRGILDAPEYGKLCLKLPRFYEFFHCLFV